jgi:hypothetical protein
MPKKLEERYPFDVPGLFSGLRTLSLSFQASLFELIDNSIGHGNAEKIDLRIEWYDNNSERLSRVAVIDNGIGMDQERLFSALITGKSSSYNQRNTIGRFGFGLKAGGLNQCKVIEVYSKIKNSDPYYSVLDYDAFMNGKIKLSPPVNKNIPEEFKDVVKDQGTVVIWTNLDIAQTLNQNEDLDKLRYEIGRTFRKFIGEEILDVDKEGKSIPIKNKNKKIMFVNGIKTLPWDPLYHTKIPGFERDPRSEITYEDKLIMPIHVGEEIDPEDMKKLKKFDELDGAYGDVIKIRFSILPEEWREVSKQGDSDFNKQRWIPENEGISILRAGREVATKSIYQLTGKRESVDRWWGLEIEYPPTLDRWFQIKNVKVGLEPNKILRKKLDEDTSIKSTKNRAVGIIQDHWNGGEVKGRDGESRSSGEHEPAEDRFKDQGIGRPKVFEDMTEEEKTEYYKKLEERFEDFDVKVDRERFEELNIKFFNDTDLPQNLPFIDINPKLGITELTYNLQHVFFRNINEIMNDQKILSEKLEKIDEHELADNLRDTVGLMRYCLDLLLGSFASAQVSIDPYAKQEVKTTLMNLLSQWTTMLQIVTEDESFKKRIHE